MKFRKLLWSALATWLSNAAYATDIDYALTSEGANFVSASSEIDGPNTTMENNLLSNTPISWLPNGDLSFMFAAGDPTQSITINLGSLRDINSIGAEVEMVDRPVNINTFSIEVSTNGTTWTNWTGTQTVIVNPIGTYTTGDLISITGSTQAVESIQYIFGPSPNDGAQGYAGSRVIQLFADNITAVPLPSSVWMFASGILGLIGMKRRKQ